MGQSSPPIKELEISLGICAFKQNVQLMGGSLGNHLVFSVPGLESHKER